VSNAEKFDEDIEAIKDMAANIARLETLQELRDIINRKIEALLCEMEYKKQRRSW
jgi:hypothetical protein